MPSSSPTPKRPGLLRTLVHYWRMNLAVAAGAAVASAVLAGALLVGDSVRGSLRQLTLERLGETEHALAAPTFFGDSTAEHMSTRLGGRHVAPAIVLQGQAQHAKSKARASQVALQGVDARFLELFPEITDPDTFFPEPRSPVFPPATLNEGLARQLDAEVGDQVLISLERWTDVPRGSLLGRKDTGSVVRTLRLEVVRILPDRGLGRFGLAAHQSLPLNVFLPLEDLQEALDQEGTANALLVATDGEVGTPEQGAEEAARLDDALASSLELEDLGLRLTRDAGAPGVLAVESREFILKPTLAAAVEQLAERQGARHLPILTYLVNRFEVASEQVEDEGNARRRPYVPYSTVTALDPTHLQDAPFGDLRRADGTPVTELAEGEILLNRWTAEALSTREQLEAGETIGVGDEIELTYFVVGPREELDEHTRRFQIAGIIEIAGLGADPSLAQEYPGIADTDNMADWDPPFPLDLGAVRSEDETYWDEHRGTPKAFVAEAEGRALWQTRWGQLTTIRLAPAGGSEAESLKDGELTEALDALETSLREDLPREIELASFGLRFLPVRAQGLGASGGATDFGGLFLGFSLFLIVSAALLAALLFQLGVEQRVGEIGLRRAIGEPAASVRRRLLVEGGLVAALGAALGLAGAVAYASAMMAGLRSDWLPAVGTSRLDLYVTPTSLVAGWAIAVAVVIFAIWRTVARTSRIATPQLLARVTEVPSTRPGRAARRTAWITLSLAAVALAGAIATGQIDNPTVFFVVGPALLVGLLALYALRLAGGRRADDDLPRPGLAGFVRMAASNSGRHRGRSLLSASLVASASFLIVTVAAYQQDFSKLELGKESGSGGFALVAETAIPLHQDLNATDDRFELGLPGDADETLAGVHSMPFRLLPGDDTSCLNLYKPGRPRILGVPPEQIERGGFTFAQTLDADDAALGSRVDPDDPWTLLHAELGEGVIPAIGDFNSTQWILKLKIGDDLVMEDEAGREIRLRLVGALTTSIFQSELLIAEEHFVELFPSREGYPYHLIDLDAPSAAGDPATGTPNATENISPERVQEVATYLERHLDAYGFDAMTAGEKLEAFHAVQNTFLETFRTLGGLGLLLGTLGLAVVLLRNVLERRGELAMLRAFGFRRSSLTRLVMLENALLLFVGLGIGAGAALVTVAPHLVRHAEDVPWGALGVTLGAIFAVGLVACSIAAAGALRVPLLPALKAER